MVSSPRLLPLLVPFLAATAVFLPQAGCSSSTGSVGAPPIGVTCGSVKDGGVTAASLTTALKAATAGSCVLVHSTTYSGSFSVPAGVTLASASGERATLAGGAGGTASSPAAVVDLAGGAGTGLANLDVNGAPGVGVAVRDGAAKVSDVKVTGAASAALAAVCHDPSTCLDDAHVVELVNVTLASSFLGLWTGGAHVKMNGGASTDHTTTSLSGGMGVVAQSGAKLELIGVDIERNVGVGVLVDGAGGTTGVIQDTTVSNNADRGIWVQGLNATLDSPGLTIQGNTVIHNNKIVGFGAAQSHGIIFVGGTVDSTQLAPVVTDLGTTDMVGDGVGVFAGSGDVKLDNVTVMANDRAAGLIDHNHGVIIFVGGKVQAGASSLLVVVQNPDVAANVQVPPSEVSSSATALSVSAPQLPITSVLE